MRARLIIFFTGVFFVSFGQDLIEVSVSNKTPRVGDFFSITCTLKDYDLFPKSSDSLTYYPARYLSSDSSIHQTEYKGLEIIDVKDSSYTLKNVKMNQRVYSLVAWDSCELSLDGFKYRTENKTIESEKVYLKVSFYEAIEGIEIYDIRESFSSWKASGSRSIIIWLLIISALALALLSFIFWVKRTLERRKKNHHFIPLEERVILDINRLYSEELWLNQKLQEHFVRFSYLLRSYLTERFEVSFLDKTTYQSKILLKKIDLHEASRTKIVELLTASDFVKFADSSVSNERIAFLKNAIINVIEETTPKEKQGND